MPRQSNGQYVAPANTAAVGGTTISSSAFNTLETDIGTEITNSVDRGGRSAMTAALPMGNQKITGMADPTVATDGATKNYVDTTTAAFFSTGDCKLTFKNTPDTGWILATNGTTGHNTVGSAGSGATYANANTQALFNLLFVNLSDADAPLLTSGGAATTRAAQTNAATAWAANCRIQVGFFAARTLGIAGNPPELALARVLGNHIGADTFTIAANNIPTLNSSGSNSITVSTSGASLVKNATIVSFTTGGGAFTGAILNNGTGIGDVAASGNNSISVAYTNGSPTAVSLYQPTSFLNMMVKL